MFLGRHALKIWLRNKLENPIELGVIYYKKLSNGSTAITYILDSSFLD